MNFATYRDTLKALQESMLSDFYQEMSNQEIRLEDKMQITSLIQGVLSIQALAQNMYLLQKERQEAFLPMPSVQLKPKAVDSENYAPEIKGYMQQQQQYNGLSPIKARDVMSLYQDQPNTMNFNP